MMAGDKQFTHGSGMVMKGATKIHELPEATAKNVFGCKRAFVGFCGNADNFATAIEWLYDPTKKVPKVKDIEMLLLNNRGEIYHASTLSNWMRIMEPHYAIGSGMMFAQAAMTAGKDPVEAVKIASKHDRSTGCGWNKLVMKA